MAYVPDEAIERMYFELSPAAMALYMHYCKKRNRKSGSFGCPADQVLREISGMKRANYFVAKKELIEKGWVEFDRDTVTPIVGFESPENPTITVDEEVQKTRLQSPENPTLDSDKSPENPTQSPENPTPHICITNDLTNRLSADADESNDSIDHKLQPDQKRKKNKREPKGHPDHPRGMALLADLLGGPCSDMGAQGKSLKWMLEHGYSINEIEEYLPSHVAEYREKELRPSFLTLAKMIGEYRARNRTTSPSSAKTIESCERCSDTPGWMASDNGNVRCLHAPPSNVVSTNRRGQPMRAAVQVTP